MLYCLILMPTQNKSYLTIKAFLQFLSGVPDDPGMKPSLLEKKEKKGSYFMLYIFRHFQSGVPDDPGMNPSLLERKLL